MPIAPNMAAGTAGGESLTARAKLPGMETLGLVQSASYLGQRHSQCSRGSYLPMLLSVRSV